MVDVDIMYNMLRFSNDVYQPTSIFPSTLDIENEATGVFVRMYNIEATSEITIAFRGTEDSTDWFANMMRWSVPIHYKYKVRIHPMVKVHSGFDYQLYSIYDILVAQVLARLSSQPNQTIHITGHSLGGALSILFGILMALRFPHTDVRVVAVASPRIGNQRMRNLCDTIKNLIIVRVVRPFDIVTKLPYFGFYHVGAKYKLPGSRGKYQALRMKHNHNISSYVAAIPQAIPSVL